MALEGRSPDVRILGRAAFHRGIEQRWHRDPERNRRLGRVGGSDHLLQNLDTGSPGVECGLGADPRIEIAQQVADARLEEGGIRLDPHDATQGRQPDVGIGIVHGEGERSRHPGVTHRCQSVHAGAPHISAGMGSGPDERFDDAPGRQHRNQLEH